MEIVRLLIEMRAVPTDPAEYRKAVEKIKARVARWPSAYASGMVVTEYKRAMGVLGKEPYINTPTAAAKTQPLLRPLARWYAEKWIDIRTGKPCGAVHTADYYPTCRPSKQITKQSPVIAAALTETQKRRMIAQKQTAQAATVHYSQTAAVRKKQRSPAQKRSR